MGPNASHSCFHDAAIHAPFGRFSGLTLGILKPQSHQANDHVTTYLRPKNGQIVERTYDWSQMSYDWSQRSRVIARGKSAAARLLSCLKPSHTGLTTRLRPTCDRKMLQSWANIEERTHDWSQRSYDWSQRSCVIARGKSVEQGRWSCSKLVVPPYDRWHHQTIAHA